MLTRLRAWLFGREPEGAGTARQVGTRLIHQISHGGLRDLGDSELMDLVDYLLTTPQLRYPLRGSTRFLQSVAAQYHRNRSISPKQRQGILNVLEQAYPHNLAAELKRFN